MRVDGKSSEDTPMKLRNAEKAIVSERKIVRYLLSHSHPEGKSKARFFQEFGFDARNWEVTANALRSHAQNNDIARSEVSPFGTRYIIDGMLKTPTSVQAHVRSVWFIETGEEIPHFVTAVPLKRIR
jgi:hypothetical protein